MMKQNYLIPLHSNKIYHIYNRTNNREEMFLSEENRYFFLRQYFDYLSSFVDTYAYCLMDTHFHFLIKVKPATELFSEHQSGDAILGGKLVSQQFRKLFISYTKAFNKRYNRHGNLFQRPFKRKLVEDEVYLRYLIYYIHRNPYHHDDREDFRDYPYSSYPEIINGDSHLVARKKVLDFFGGELFFMAYHNQRRINDISRYDISLFDRDVISRNVMSAGEGEKAGETTETETAMHHTTKLD